MNQFFCLSLTLLNRSNKPTHYLNLNWHISEGLLKRIKVNLNSVEHKSGSSLISSISDKLHITSGGNWLHLLKSNHEALCSTRVFQISNSYFYSNESQREILWCLLQYTNQPTPHMSYSWFFQLIVQNIAINYIMMCYYREVFCQSCSQGGCPACFTEWCREIRLSLVVTEISDELRMSLRVYLLLEMYNLGFCSPGCVVSGLCAEPEWLNELFE